MVNTVEQWREHTEIAMGFREGVTRIGTAEWTRRIYETLCRGEPAFGATTTNAMEALLRVVRERDPDKYDLALKGLGRTVEQGRREGKALDRLAAMYERMGGEPLASR